MPRLARPALSARRRHAARAQRRVVLADREARVVLVDERLPVEPERLGVGAEEAAHVRRRRQDVEPLVLERAEVLRADLRPLLELGEVEVLAEAGLAEAGADVEHERGIVERSPARPVSRASRRTRAGRRRRARRAPRGDAQPDDAEHAARASRGRRPLAAPRAQRSVSEPRAAREHERDERRAPRRPGSRSPAWRRS